MQTAADPWGPPASSTRKNPPLTRAVIIALCVILGCGLALRLAALGIAMHTPGYVWVDPDGYMKKARRLAAPDGWTWTFDAVTYTINGQRHALPPMYSVFLSLFAMWPGFPVSAQLAQVGLAVLSIGLLFGLGRLLHSARAGLIAAAVMSLWVPQIFNVWSTSQETLYLPLILAALLLLGRAVDRDGRPRAFAAAGLVFGIAALTRSMPLFFAAPAAIAHVALAHDRRRACLQSGAFLAGFLLLTAPYSVALSRHFGQLTIVDTHGSIHFDPVPGARAPTLLQTAKGLWRDVTTRPSHYLFECVARARSLLHVNGGRILQIYVVAGSKASATAWKTFVHLGSDALLVFVSILAAVGAALCQRPRVAVFLILWTLINIGVASAAGFGGARLRAPFEPVLIVLASVVVAGSWRRPPAAVLAIAAVASVLAAAAVLPQIPNSLRAWPDYGVVWPSVFNRTSTHFTGTAGLNVAAFDGVARLNASTDGTFPVRLHVRVGGVHVQTVDVMPAQIHTIETRWPDRGLAFVELEQAGPAALPAAIALRVPRR